MSQTHAGVDQTTVIEALWTERTVTGAHGTQSDALTPVNDGAVVCAALTCSSATAPSVGGIGQNLAWSQRNATESHCGGFSFTPPAATTATWNWSATGAASVQIVFALIPAIDAPAPPPPTDTGGYPLPGYGGGMGMGGRGGMGTAQSAKAKMFGRLLQEALDEPEEQPRKKVAKKKQTKREREIALERQRILLKPVVRVAAVAVVAPVRTRTTVATTLASGGSIARVQPAMAFAMVPTVQTSAGANGMSVPAWTVASVLPQMAFGVLNPTDEELAHIAEQLYQMEMSGQSPQQSS
jgi:hypothetical protein